MAAYKLGMRLDQEKIIVTCIAHMARTYSRETTRIEREMAVEKRKGAARIADVPEDILAKLNAGHIEAATLSENLATDFNALLASVLPQVIETTTIDPKAGITKRMAAAAEAIIATGDDVLPMLQSHRSDLIRGWGAYVLAALPELTFAEKLMRMRDFADDTHFGVREWAWLAMRPQIVKQPEDAVALLQPWVTDGSENVRRFAIEAVRPRGVWSAHIALFKSQPETARALLDPVTSDPARYVQDSVANWLNDAWKTSPEWVEGYCATLAQGQPSDATQYIIKRALRNKK
jgi:3-methyladenine DNA glycosylase AlkC